MAYEESKDVLLLEKVISRSPYGDLTIQAYSYNGGDPKLFVKRSLGERHFKLGRLTLEEGMAVANGIAFIAKQLNTRQGALVKKAQARVKASKKGGGNE